jgi:nickel-type superoxide dismutase maturation protease
VRKEERLVRARWLMVGLVVGTGTMLAARVAERVRITGPSMEPVLRDGDRVLVNRLAYLLRRPRPGEVVLARVSTVPGGVTVKRIAAVEGSGHLILLGDNRAQSTDSRHFGAVPPRAVVGRVWYRYWPPQRRGRLPRPAVHAPTTAPTRGGTTAGVAVPDGPAIITVAGADGPKRE